MERNIVLFERHQLKKAKDKLNWFYILETLRIFRRSLIYQTKEFFENSTLHGVRYIAENGRPVAEKFMWFCFTSIGAISALVIIMSLWEKFQTNPTITGLDTDFSNQNVDFPTTVVCPVPAFDESKLQSVANNLFNQRNEQVRGTLDALLEALTSLNLLNAKDVLELGKSLPSDILSGKSLRELAFNISINCEDVVLSCNYRDATLEECCKHFSAVYTEHGYCYAFNSRFRSLPNMDETIATPHVLYETDKKWAFFILPNVTSKIFIYSNEEYFGSDFNAQLDFSEGQTAEVRISKKQTYTTEDARQLSIEQRKCIFHDEVKLNYFPNDYTFTSCMKECRMKLAIQLCKCNPPFYKPIDDIPTCTIADFECLVNHRSNITDIRNCMQCELSCSKSVFNVEKLTKITDDVEKAGVLIEFLTWPIIRYKREVLFGWVDLLVSFGGIASLFLGFSLLSAVEIVYYFTLRACCMVHQKRQDLFEIEEEIRNRPPPYVNLTLKIPLNSLKRKSLHEADTTKLTTRRPTNLEKQQRLEKDMHNFTKTLFRQPKISPFQKDDYKPSHEQLYGPYLP